MKKTSHWNHSFDLNPHDSYGFVYYIENLVSGKKYIGKKQYYSYRKNKKYKESDWQKYTSSSKQLNEDLNNIGINNFYFEILLECKYKGDLSYVEANIQHKCDVLTQKDKDGNRIWYNSNIAAIKFIPKFIDMIRGECIVGNKTEFIYSKLNF